MAPSVRAAIGEGFGLRAGQAMEGQTVAALRRLGFDYVFDTQFAADLTIMEEGASSSSGFKAAGRCRTSPPAPAPG